MARSLIEADAGRLVAAAGSSRFTILLRHLPRSDDELGDV
jgi:hypothetical protein